MITRRRKLRDLIRSGQDYWLMDCVDEALAEFNRAIELDPSDASYYAARGQAYQAMGRNEEALADYDRAVELDPSYQPPTV